VTDATSAIDALMRVAALSANFVSRGDDSGTHKAELALWEDVGGLPTAAWYKPLGAGMGAALNTAAGLGAHVLSDRASWLNFKNKEGLALLFSGDPRLFNQYAFLPINPVLHAHVDAESARALETWLTSETAAKLINGYKINGEPLFVFNARPS